jgi:hypothetical protein
MLRLVSLLITSLVLCHNIVTGLISYEEANRRRYQYLQDEARYASIGDDQIQTPSETSDIKLAILAPDLYQIVKDPVQKRFSFDLKDAIITTSRREESSLSPLKTLLTPRPSAKSRVMIGPRLNEIQGTLDLIGSETSTKKRIGHPGKRGRNHWMPYFTIFPSLDLLQRAEEQPPHVRRSNPSTKRWLPPRRRHHGRPRRPQRRDFRSFKQHQGSRIKDPNADLETFDNFGEDYTANPDNHNQPPKSSPTINLEEVLPTTDYLPKYIPISPDHYTPEDMANTTPYAPRIDDALNVENYVVDYYRHDDRRIIRKPPMTGPNLPPYRQPGVTYPERSEVPPQFRPEPERFRHTNHHHQEEQHQRYPQNFNSEIILNELPTTMMTTTTEKLPTDRGVKTRYFTRVTDVTTVGGDGSPKKDLSRTNDIFDEDDAQDSPWRPFEDTTSVDEDIARQDLDYDYQSNQKPYFGSFETPYGINNGLYNPQQQQQQQQQQQASHEPRYPSNPPPRDYDEPITYNNIRNFEEQPNIYEKQENYNRLTYPTKNEAIDPYESYPNYNRPSKPRYPNPAPSRDYDQPPITYNNIRNNPDSGFENFDNPSTRYDLPAPTGFDNGPVQQSYNNYGSHPITTPPKQYPSYSVYDGSGDYNPSTYQDQRHQTPSYRRKLQRLQKTTRPPAAVYQVNSVRVNKPMYEGIYQDAVQEQFHDDRRKNLESFFQKNTDNNEDSPNFQGHFGPGVAHAEDDDGEVGNRQIRPLFTREDNEDNEDNEDEDSDDIFESYSAPVRERDHYKFPAQSSGRESDFSFGSDSNWDNFFTGHADNVEKDIYNMAKQSDDHTAPPDDYKQQDQQEEEQNEQPQDDYRDEQSTNSPEYPVSSIFTDMRIFF